MKASILFALAVLVSVSWAEEALPCSPDLPLGSQPISLSTFCQQNPETPGNEQPDQGLGLQDAAGNPGVAWQDCGPYAAPCDSLLSAPPAPQVMPSHLESSPQDFLPPAEHPIASQAQGEEPAGAANSGRSPAQPSGELPEEFSAVVPDSQEQLSEPETKGPTMQGQEKNETVQIHSGRQVRTGEENAESGTESRQKGSTARQLAAIATLGIFLAAILAIVVGVGGYLLYRKRS
ncbi:TPA: hypothetical protein HA225_05065 [Candidatus Micrarchaeota archaeon]|nr:hypothetical protein [Candidatus Micrarchaeota archaeon]HIH30950.1 hypothetical protein [Candidatus Micrarchaeota archaeon]